MALYLAFISFGFLGGAFCVTYIVVTIKNRDEMLIRDLLDRLISPSPGDYLNLVYQREQLGLKDHTPWYKNFSLKPISKKQPVVPTIGELETLKAKKKAAEAVAEANREPTEDELFDRQQAVRASQGRDQIIP